jgi:hypothetical protein
VVNACSLTFANHNDLPDGSTRILLPFEDADILWKSRWTCTGDREVLN